MKNRAEQRLVAKLRERRATIHNKIKHQNTSKLNNTMNTKYSTNRQSYGHKPAYIV